MKRTTRIAALLLALVMLCALLPVAGLNAEAAATKYDLYFCGIRVTSQNKDDILGEGYGSVVYNPDLNELVIRRDIIAPEGKIGVDNRIKGLTLWLGGNIGVNNADCVIKSSADLKIKTNGMYECAIDGNNNSNGISITKDSTLTLEDASLEFTECSAYAISGRNTGKEKLVIRASNVYVEDTIAISYFRGGIKFEDSTVVSPEKYKTSNGCIVGSNGNPLTALQISADITDTYAVYVDGVVANNLNKDDMFRDGGSAKYDPQFHVLTLNNPKFDARFGYLLDIYGDDFTLRGKASFSGAVNNTLIMLDGTTINGDFSFTNTLAGCLTQYSKNLKFAGGKMQLSGVGCALHSYGTMEFSGGDVTITATVPAGASDEEVTCIAFYSSDELTLSGGTQILTPKNGKIEHYEDEDEEDAEYWYVANAKGNYAEKVRIAVTNNFEDVKSSAEYCNAVLWAANHKPYQVTAGLDKTHFGPDKTVTRAQGMVFFWAAMDRPKFKKASTQFVDVKKTDWFYKAVMWAVENKITSGTDATHFSPNKTCNRGEILAFLYAAVKKPKVTIENPYKDVSNQWYKKAALWAYEQGIERGEKGKFNAATACTRASTVLYLYRFLERQDLDLD